MKQNKFVFCLLAAVMLLLTACDIEKKETGFFDEDVLSIATFLESNKEEFSRYWQILETVGLYTTLNAYNPNGDDYTLFLPTDEAFDRYIQQNDKYDSFEALLQDYEFLWLISRYHIVNIGLISNDFPYGALPDSTITGDYLTVGIEVTEDSSLYMINNTAPVVIQDIETTNGYIHVIGEVLEPISYNSYEWLANKEGYSILSKAFDESGLKDTMGIYRYSSTGQLIKNGYTVFAEHDSVFQRKGILTFEDLVDHVHTPGYELDDPEGGLYQFAAYHMLEGRYFLDAFEGSSNYNSYAVYPVSISAGIDIRLNTGVDTFRLEISGSDTTWINYVGLFYQESNVNTKNGPVHFIDEVLELYQPARSERIFQLRDDLLIIEARSASGTYEFVEPEQFEKLWWDGTELLIYENGTQAENQASDGDYFELHGNFDFSYIIPKIMPGRYLFYLRTDRVRDGNATIQVWVDGKRMGGNTDLTSGGNANNPWVAFSMGILEFASYEEHLLEISTLIPGTVRLDYVSFDPE